jgi:hypothetical protein
MVEFEVFFYQEQWLFFYHKISRRTNSLLVILGEVNENPSDEEYTFKKIYGNPMNSALKR